jgi:hypothetical protein
LTSNVWGVSKVSLAATVMYRADDSLHSCCHPLLLLLLLPAGITEAMLRQPGVPQLPAAWAALLNFLAQHTPHGAQAVLAAHNGFTFDFKMLAACLLRAQQQLEIAAAGCACCAGGSSRECRHHGNSTCSSSSSAELRSSCCEIPAGVLAVDSLVLARRLQLKQQASLPNLQQGV